MSIAEITEARNEKETKAQSLLPGLLKKEQNAIAQFFELFSDDIYNFPIRFFRFNEDDAGDFYLYAFEHLKDGRKMASYRGKSRFTTWFFSVLRNLTIDFIRTQKEKIKYTAFVKLEPGGKLLDTMDSISDEKPVLTHEEELFENFANGLSQLNLSQRVLFKLAYIFYFELDSEELTFLSEKNKTTPENILKQIARLKDLAHEKSTEVREYEDKLTGNFQSISALEGKIESFFRENPQIPQKRESWDENYSSGLLPPQISDLIQTLMRKKKKQQNLLSQQKKSLLSVRIPYKEIGALMHGTQGVLSVKLIRIIEKLNQSVS